MFALTALALAQIVLSPALEKWKAEIELKAGAPVIILRGLPENLRTPDLETQFSRAEALSIQNSERRYIILNPAQLKESAEPPVLAHELGHVWLKATGYPPPRYDPGPAGCLSIQTGDIVQHILIRAEMDRRQIAWRPHWLETLELALAQLLKQKSEPQPGCQAATQLALWIDVKLSLSAASWPRFDAFEKAMAANFPDLGEPAASLAKRLAATDLTGKIAYRQALQFTFDTVKAAALQARDKLNSTAEPL